MNFWVFYGRRPLKDQGKLISHVPERLISWLLVLPSCPVYHSIHLVASASSGLSGSPWWIYIFSPWATVHIFQAFLGVWHWSSARSYGRTVQTTKMSTSWQNIFFCQFWLPNNEFFGVFFLPTGRLKTRGHNLLETPPCKGRRQNSNITNTCSNSKHTKSEGAV